MIWEKIKILLVFIIAVAGCSVKTENMKALSYEEVINNTFSSLNFIYENEINTKVDNLKIVTRTTYYLDGETVQIKYSENLQELNGINEHYVYNGRNYINSINGKVYYDDNTKLQENLENMFAFKDALSIESNVVNNLNVFSIILSKDKEKLLYYDIMETMKINEENIIDKSYEIKAKADYKLTEITKKIMIKYNNGNKDVTYITNEKISFRDFGKIKVNLPNDIEEYINIDEIKYDVYSLLVELLGYEIKGNIYELKFNQHEVYQFDKENSLFNYMIFGDTSSYNFQTNIGSYNKCVYDFNTGNSKGNCIDEEINRIKETKIYLGIELESIDMSINDLK